MFHKEKMIASWQKNSYEIKGILNSVLGQQTEVHQAHHILHISRIRVNLECSC